MDNIMNFNFNIEQLYDKILGCWTGKSIGGIIGAPYECHKHFKECDPDHLWPKKLYPNILNPYSDLH